MSAMQKVRDEFLAMNPAANADFIQDPDWIKAVCRVIDQQAREIAELRNLVKYQKDEA